MESALKIGSVVGLLMVTGDPVREPKGNHYRVPCSCSCGQEKMVRVAHLRSRAVLSCGCYKASLARKHGASGTLTYASWLQIMARCYNPRHKAFPRYGGSGVCVWYVWRASFAAFRADMGERPSALHSIDRYPDRTGNYEPGNCRWATRREQNQNTSRNKFLTLYGYTLTQSEWARRLMIQPKTIEGRLARGWSVERALITLAKTWHKGH